jgi:prophage regulatory protein
MAAAKPRPSIAPRLLRRERAAVYLDISPVTFDRLVKDGTLPAPKKLYSFKVWDRDDLDALVDHLPYDRTANAPDISWDD